MSEPLDRSKRTDGSPHLICAVGGIAAVERFLFGYYTGVTSGVHRHHQRAGGIGDDTNQASTAAWCVNVVAYHHRHPETPLRSPRHGAAPPVGKGIGGQHDDAERVSTTPSVSTPTARNRAGRPRDRTVLTASATASATASGTATGPSLAAEGTVPSCRCRPSHLPAPFRSWCYPPATMPESSSRPSSFLGAPIVGSRYSNQCPDQVVAMTGAVPKC